MQEAVKNYRPPEIVNAVKYKVRGPLDTHLVGDPKRELDIRKAISFLKNQGYLVERYEIPDLSTYGFVFMHSNHLKNLEQHGWLSLIDSTHKTNRYDCCLFTIYIRNSYGCWDVGAHFFVSKEDSETVATGLKAIRQFAHRWNLSLYGNAKLLTPNTWDQFQQMFDETGFDVYMHREIDLNVPVSRLTEAKNAIVNRQQSVSKLMERICDTYWRVEERGNAEQTGVFIEELKVC
ncbi:unnamed protein product [Rhizophagus irregularis]|nr:unnamed protein product [Rhizophagus irregularis]